MQKDIFINNINYLIKYDYELEFTIYVDNNEYFIILYKDYIELNTDTTYKLDNIEELFNYIDFDSITKIDSYVDFNFPIEKQSIVVDGKLWINAITPTYELNRFKKIFDNVRYTGAILIIVFLIAFSVSLFINKDLTGITSIYGILLLIVVVFLLSIFLLFRKRTILINTYYDKITEDDKEKAKKLLDKINIIDENEYDLYDALHIEEESIIIKNILKDIVKGNRIYIVHYKLIKSIEELIKEEKYNDINYNNYVHELCVLLERNTCDI